jgi:hypothetical protein
MIPLPWANADAPTNRTKNRNAQERRIEPPDKVGTL